MCGRYTLRTPRDVLKRHFGLVSVPEGLTPRYNIAPTQPVAVVPNLPERRLEMFRWGLIPSWAKDPSIGNRMINARVETAAEKPSFRTALRMRRCLVLADGFYEWTGETSPKVPMYVHMKSQEPFAFAGLWDTWRAAEDEPIFSCTILTTSPNALRAHIHNPKPVSHPPEAYSTWLEPAPIDPGSLSPLLVPFPADGMEAYAVSRLVNAPANDRPECVEAAWIDP
jgi:putative SOS response-associated peptidase YedK